MKKYIKGGMCSRYILPFMYFKSEYVVLTKHQVDISCGKEYNIVVT